LASERLLVVAGLVWIGPARLLVQRRSAAARFGAGMLELPGGKVEPGEAPALALSRELVEEWGPAASELHVGRIVELLHHVYPAPGPEVLLAVFHVDGCAWGDAWPARVLPDASGVPAAFDLAALPVAEFLAADRDFVAAVARGEIRP
jgi:8-oxo-dGTP diphosphatase